MRLTVAGKIIAGIVLILSVGSVVMLIIYNGLANIEKAVQQLADVKEPISAAAHEMEINVNGIALGVLKYLDAREPRYRKLVEKDEADFEAFHARYLKLAETKKEKDLAHTVGEFYKEYKALGTTLMNSRDQQDAIFATVSEKLEGIDWIIDNELEPKVDPKGPQGFEKVRSIGSLEADLAEVGIWLANYQRIRNPEYREHLSKNEREFWRTLATFKALNLTKNERRWIGAVEGAFNQMMLSVREVAALEDYLQDWSNRFIDVRSRVDQILDNEIQVLAQEHLYRPRREADEIVSTVIERIYWLISLFVLSSVGVALLLIRGITGPVGKLIRGTEAITRGDLTHRIVSSSRDELGQLANRFNQMVAQLEATTVSKGLLEVSEQSLQDTVASLRREMEDRERLQASLRRGETMAVMGSLVAGVAHEVRNPLFAISSTVDAFETRFAARDEYQRYLGVLRKEVNRLTGLMRALLEYGKPPSQQLVPDSIEDILRQAVRLCAPLAERLNVKISESDGQGRRLVRMDRERLLQVFQNLIENAIQHSAPGGSVALEAQEICEEGQLWIGYAIKDSGPGFSQDDLPKIFEPFFTRRRGGTGLGLSIVQRIVEEHGGRIAAGNRPEGGAVVVVRFPLVQQTIQEESEQEVRRRGTQQDLGR